MRLSDFIKHNKESILQAWEDFSRTIQPPASTMGIAALRNHAASMLDTIVLDMESPQTRREQLDKSKGQGPHETGESSAEIHGTQRLQSGYTIDQLVSEFRALRASVLKLWAAAGRQAVEPAEREDVNRFNEAVDQALAESVARFSQTADRVESERHRLDAILQAAPVGISMTDRSGKLVLTNAENRKIFGPDPFTDKAAGIAVSPELKGWWADGSQRNGRPVEPGEWAAVRALQGEVTVRDVVEIEKFDAPGIRKTVSAHAAPVFDAEGAIVGAVAAYLDITGQVATEVALRDSEAKFHTIADAMPQMVWSSLPDGHVDYFNEQWYLFTGTARGSIDGDGWKELVHPEDRHRAMALWRESLSTGLVYDIQFRLRHHSGQYRWVLDRALPVRNAAGKIIRWMGTCTDIDDQKLAEEDLKQGSRRMDDFLAMLAHELRNPLAPISTASEILHTDGIGQDLAKEATEIISRQVRHMSSLVDDLLDVSRVKRGLVTLEKEPQDIKPIVHSAIEQVRALIETRGHMLTVRMTPESTFVEADRVRLAQVISNLLNNAAKYTHQHGAIELAVEVKGGQVQLSVTDNGMGIDATLLPHVFELFAQGTRTPDRAQGGLGLGLALVKSMVELHGGTVQAASGGAGQGSTFTVLLPRCQPTPSSSIPLPARASHILRSKSLRLVVADDNTDAAKALANWLRLVGHQVTVRFDGTSVLGDIPEPPPHAFILDIGLPDVDGYELARKLKARPETANATLIALTGYGQAHDRVLSRAAGFDHHFVKPVELTQLQNVLDEIAAGRTRRPRIEP